MSRELFAGELPVIVNLAENPLQSRALDGVRLGQAGAAETLRGSAETNGVASYLSASLVLSPAAVVSFTLGDLRDRLFHLSFELKSEDYAPIRDAHALRVDFSTFPHRVAELLNKPGNDAAFVAILRLPTAALPPPSIFPREAGRAGELEDPDTRNDDRPAAVTALFSLVERNQFRNLSHLALPMQVSSELLTRRAIADRAKRAEVRAASAEQDAASAGEKLQAELAARRAAEEERNVLRARVAEFEAERAEIEAQRERLKREQSELGSLQARIGELEGMVVSREEEIANTQNRNRNIDELVARVEEAESRQTAEASKRERLMADLNAAREDSVASERRFSAAVDEIHKGNRIIAKLQAAAATGRRKARAAESILERQEAIIEDNQKRVADLERDLRNTREKLQLAEIERDGAKARASSYLDQVLETSRILNLNKGALELAAQSANQASQATTAYGEASDSPGRGMTPQSSSSGPSPGEQAAVGEGGPQAQSQAQA